MKISLILIILFGVILLTSCSGRDIQRYTEPVNNGVKVVIVEF